MPAHSSVNVTLSYRGFSIDLWAAVINNMNTRYPDKLHTYRKLLWFSDSVTATIYEWVQYDTVKQLIDVVSPDQENVSNIAASICSTTITEARLVG